MPRRLLVLDVEGTLFQNTISLPETSLSSTIWQAIAHELGPEAVTEEVETHRRWERGEYASYLDWMAATVEIHRRYRLREDAFRRIIADAAYNPGVPEALARIDRTVYEPVLVSGGFRSLGERVQRDFGIKHLFAACDYYFDDRGALTGFNLLPCDFEGKLDFIRLMLREYSVDESDWVFVGDGGNDIPIARQAPTSIGYRPHPGLAAIVTHVIESFSELPDLLRLASSDAQG